MEIPRAGPETPGYTVRRLRAEDATGVAACVRRVYGDSYLHRELYQPDQIIRLNETGELVSVVALDAGEQVVGHYALERPGLGAIAEEVKGTPPRVVDFRPKWLTLRRVLSISTVPAGA